MKNKNKALLSLVLVCTLLFLLTSCLWIDSGVVGDSGNGDYVTKGEISKLLQGVKENITVNAGDNNNIQINSSENQNLVAASKGLLSAVSIHCKFKITTMSTPLFGTPTPSTETVSSAGSGVIYTLDKTAGSAYIITNYHVVYCKGADTDNDISDDITIHLYGLEDS